METAQEGKDGKCCETKKCCGKVACAAALLLIGGLGGFFAGRHCNKVCPLSSAPAVSAPAAPAQK